MKIDKAAKGILTSINQLLQVVLKPLPLSATTNLALMLHNWHCDGKICFYCTSLFSILHTHNVSSLDIAAKPLYLKLLFPYKHIMFDKFDGNVTFDIMTYQFSRMRRTICANRLLLKSLHGAKI